MAGSGDSVKGILYALAANMAIAVAKFVAAFITGSGSMMAEAIHSTADCGNQLLLLFGLKQSKQAPDADYPLGYGKEMYFWSFIVALMLFSMGGLYSIYEGIHKLHDPQPLNAPWVAIGVLIFGIIVEGAALLGVVKIINKTKGNRGLWRWFRESRQSELIVIFGEDLAATFGLIVALIAISLAMITGNPIFDAFGSIGIGILLLVIAVLIGIEVKALLVGQGVDPLKKKEMLAFLEKRPEIERVFNLVTLQMGADVMVAVKVEMTEKESAVELLDGINTVEQSFRESFTEVKWLFFEPDTKD